MAGRRRKPTAELTLIEDGGKVKGKPTTKPQLLTDEERERLNKPVDEVLLGFDRRLDELEIGYRNLAKLTKMVYEVSSATMQAVNETRDAVREIKTMCFTFHGVEPAKPTKRNGK